MSFFTVTNVHRRQSAFTIVELLIVIVVIAILATISIVAYNGIQTRAHDTARADSIAKIKRALELYKVDNGRYPSATPNPGANGGWESSTDTGGTFIEALGSSYGFPNGSPIDPVNDATYRILYYRYPAGNGGCDASKGGFYVLMATFEDSVNKPVGNSTATECTAPQGQWSDQSGGTHYAFHAYEN